MSKAIATEKDAGRDFMAILRRAWEVGNAPSVRLFAPIHDNINEL
jgi:hypothetical protein